MANGVVVISPAEAVRKAGEMKKIAGNLEELLNEAKTKINEIDNVETGTYQGSKKPAELRAELDSFSDMFYLAYEQIIKSADDIITMANVSENQ